MILDRHQLIRNKTNLDVFDIFSKEYGQKAIALFPDFKKIQINAVYHNNSSDKDSFNKYDAFGFYYDFQSELKYAEIIINIDACMKLKLTEMEMIAATAHEMGHIRYTEINQTTYQGEDVELECDDFACSLGLGKPLYSLLKRLIDSDLCPEELLQIINERLFVISVKRKDDSYVK